ncbi:MAG TPA: ABC transporter permease [Steroidobacteraceae bacterium]|nr:ABC transporter permease [Steroidobacteraceae bacterium]
MRALWTVFLKELLENARDRRTLLSALVIGPLGGPLLFGLMMNLTLERGRERAEQALELQVAGRSAAPNLVAFLEREGVKVSELPGGAAAAAAAVRSRSSRLVLVIPDNYGARLRAGEPAGVRLYTDTSDTSASGDRARAEALLRAYGGQIAAWRLQARGLSPLLMQPVAVDEVDVSTPAARALALLGMLSYFVVFATLMGGLYVAIDTTAGERERGSLEPLLTLPVARRALVYGKILAAGVYMALSLLLNLAAFALSLRFVRLDTVGMALNLGPGVALAIFAVMLPFVLVGSSLMTIVASFTRTYREAQSWLAAVLLVPTLPIIFASLYQVPSRTALMWVPSLSQHLLIQALLRGEAPGALHVSLSVGATLAIGALLAWIAARLYARERILG